MMTQTCFSVPLEHVVMSL